MSIERAPDGQGENVVVTNPDMSVLVVRSEIAGLSFVSTRGILEVDQPANGIYHVKVEPGVNVFTINAPGFQAITGFRLAMPKKAAITVDVTVLEPASGARGTLRIESIPPGATITLNDVTLADKTPVALPNQPTGSNSVHLKADDPGYASVDTTVIIDVDQTTTLDVTLPRLQASLSVTSDPSGALVILDGEDLGVTPLTRTDLTPGDKTLAVMLDGYGAITQPVRLSTDEIAVINTYLVRLTGRIEVTTSTEGAEIFINGEFLARYENSPLVRDGLEPGPYTVNAALDGYEVSRNVIVESGRTAEVHLAINQHTGSIYLISTPNGASIKLDGRDTGVVTPGRLDDVSLGSHSITLRKAGFQDTTETVTVNLGRTVTLAITFEEKRASQASRSLQDSLDPLSISYGPFPGMTFVNIPGGSFMMGAQSDEIEANDNEYPLHHVTISSFEMMTTEVTQEIWAEVMRASIQEQRDKAGKDLRIRGEGDDYPIYYVSWNEVQEFINRLNRRLDPGKRYRLPTEAEWEYACRAGTSSRYHTGDNESDLDWAGWYKVNSGQETHRVGQKASNAWGLYDMHGNVWEWCEDWYDSEYYDEMYDYHNATPHIDPQGPPTGSLRVMRGGSWFNNMQGCRSTVRARGRPMLRYSSCGFRLVRDSTHP